jgi:hypothetical protein
MDALAVRRLEQLRRLTRIMDDAVAIPGTGIRVGLDAVIGLVPALGDAVTTLVTGCGVALAASAGAPPAVLGRMLLNVAVDAALGAPPVVGDIMDVFFRANRRNLVLFERWVADPSRTHRASRLVLVAGTAGVLALMAGTLWLGWVLVRSLVSLF